MNGPSPALEKIKEHAAIDEQIRQLKAKKKALHEEISAMEGVHELANRAPSHLDQSVGAIGIDVRGIASLIAGLGPQAKAELMKHLGGGNGQ